MKDAMAVCKFGGGMEREKEITIAKRDVGLLYEVSTSIHSIGDMDKMLQSILAKIKEVFAIQGASIALHDERSKEFYFIRTIEEQQNGGIKTMVDMRFPDNFGVAGWVARNDISIVIQDFKKDDRFSDQFDFQHRLKARSMICVPLKTRKRLVGVLYAIDKLKGEFTVKDRYLLEIVASTIAIAIENAKLYGEVKANADVLQREYTRLHFETREQYNLHGMVSSSESMRKVFSLMEKVIDTKTPVLIQGKTGTGKELLAKTIHYNGPLRDQPFIAENCGALSEHLLESELFGHVKGAFTGAITDKKGIFERANKGTVFLDEIMDMSPAMQNKILRVLEEGKVRPVGGSQTIDVDFRLIASCNCNLYDEVKKGRFREDLFYRIQVFPIVLPPLKERKEDIPLLVAHFMEMSAKQLGRPVPRITPKALQFLTDYPWPGNIRELKNEIERATLLSGGGREIESSLLSDQIRISGEGELECARTDTTLTEATEQMERAMVVRALERTRGNRTQAAKALGLTRQGLLNKIKRYDL